MAEILVVDDDKSVASAFEQFLNAEGHQTRVANSASAALRAVEERRPDMVIMDNRMPGMSGLDALSQFSARFPGLCVVLMTGYGTSQTSIDAIRAGAFDYITKPPDLDDLRRVITKALASKRPLAKLSDGGDADAPIVTLVGETPAMVDLYKMIGRLANNSVPALVTGERGTGKHLVVATLHKSSSRRDHPLVVIDCAMPEAQLERELFGGAAGAGTAHVSHVDRMPLALQGRLARALTNDSSRGSGDLMAARVVASTDRELADAVAAGAFDRDLYEALSVITLRVPPLRERREDVPMLVRHLVQRLGAELGRNIRGVDDAAVRRLQADAWPGNVGELWRVLRRAAIVSRADLISGDDIGPMTEARFTDGQDTESALARTARAALLERAVDLPGGKTATLFHDIVEIVETALVKEALSITNGNQVKAADLLGVNRSTLRKKAPAE